MLAHEAVARIVAVDERIGEVFLFYLFNLAHGFVVECDFTVAQVLAYERLELVDGDVYVVFQQGDVLAHALHALADQLLVAGRDASHHVFHVRVVEHSAVHDATPGDVVEGISRHLSPADEDIIPPAGLRVHAQSVQYQHQHVDVAVEREVDPLVLCDVGEHDVAAVGIDASATALAPIGLNAVCAAVVHVHLVLYQLVASEDDRRVALPHEEAVVFVHVACHVFFHRQIEYESPVLFFR